MTGYTAEKTGSSTYLVHTNTVHGTFRVKLPAGMGEDDAKRILHHLLSTNTRASTAPRWKPQWFEDTAGKRVQLTYLGG